MQPHDPNPTAATKPFPNPLPLGHTPLNRRTRERTGRCEEGAVHELGRGCCQCRERERMPPHRRDRQGVKKGAWSPEEDEVLRQHVGEHGEKDWSSIQSNGLLRRTGKSCRLRWVNKLHPGLKYNACILLPSSPDREACSLLFRFVGGCGSPRRVTTLTETLLFLLSPGAASFLPRKSAWCWIFRRSSGTGGP
jgi:hypothetical protein